MGSRREYLIYGREGRTVSVRILHTYLIASTATSFEPYYYSALQIPP